MALQSSTTIAQDINRDYVSMMDNLDKLYDLDPNSGIKMLSLISLAAHKKVTNLLMRFETEKDWQMGLLTVEQYQLKITQYI